MTATQALNEINSLQDFFRLPTYTAEVTRTWQRLVVTEGVRGKQTHDAHLVAIMQENAVSGIFTFNGSHFRRFPAIIVLDPAELESV